MKFEEAIPHFDAKTPCGSKSYIERAQRIFHQRLIEMLIENSTELTPADQDRLKAMYKIEVGGGLDTVGKDEFLKVKVRPPEPPYDLPINIVQRAEAIRNSPTLLRDVGHQAFLRELAQCR